MSNSIVIIQCVTLFRCQWSVLHYSACNSVVSIQYSVQFSIQFPLQLSAFSIQFSFQFSFHFSCQHSVFNSVFSIQFSAQSAAFSCWLRSIPITFSHSRYSEFDSVDLDELCLHNIPSMLHSRLSQSSIFKYYFIYGRKFDYATIIRYGNHNYKLHHYKLHNYKLHHYTTVQLSVVITITIS